MSTDTELTPCLRMWPQPPPGVPYTLFLRRGWYTPRAQLALARLGFQFAAPNVYGNAEPLLDAAPLPDMLFSDVLEVLRPLRMTFSVSQARHWYGKRLRKEEFFWYLCLHHDGEE